MEVDWTSSNQSALDVLASVFLISVCRNLDVSYWTSNQSFFETHRLKNYFYVFKEEKDNTYSSYSTLSFEFHKAFLLFFLGQVTKPKTDARQHFAKSVSH